MFYSQIYAYAHGMCSSVLGDMDAYSQLTNGVYFIEDECLRMLLLTVKPADTFQLYSTINIFVEPEALNIVFGSSTVSRRLSQAFANAIIITDYLKGNYKSYSSIIDTFEELNPHAISFATRNEGFILSKCQPFTDLIRTECAD